MFALLGVLARHFPPIFRRYASKSGPRVTAVLRGLLCRCVHDQQVANLGNLQELTVHTAEGQGHTEEQRDKYTQNVLAVLLVPENEPKTSHALPFVQKRHENMQQSSDRLGCVSLSLISIQ